MMGTVVKAMLCGLLLVLIDYTSSTIHSPKTGHRHYSNVYKMKQRAKDNPYFSFDNSGNYKVTINGKTWMTNSGTYMSVKGMMYNTQDKSLSLNNVIEGEGVDKLGDWTETAWNYTASNTVMLASIRLYDNMPNVAIFTQTFSNGVVAPSVDDEDKICTGFPNFNFSTNPTLGYVAPGGLMVGWTSLSLGKLSEFNGKTGLEGGPLVLFDKSSSVLIISPFSEFMAASNYYERTDAVTFAWGVMGKAEAIPNDYSMSTIVYYGNMGINKAVAGWGELLRKQYGKHSGYRDTDMTLNYLGYWTDNGAYYYYQTEKGKTYEDTMYDVQQYAQKNKIPYRYIQYDSWFYPKGPDDGVMTWDAMPQIFPSGLQKVYNRSGLPVTAHNRWWSPKTSYAKQNGGDFDFIIGKDKAMPIHQDFWRFLMTTSKKWGLQTYEQDWLNQQFLGMDVLKSDITLGKKWLNEMGLAAREVGLTIQYCMSLSRQAMQSLEIPVVTQARVSGDYLSTDKQWQIGISSMFADAYGIAPFKDNFWSTSVQEGNKYGKNESYPFLQAVVSVMSTGPVGPSDMINGTNVTLVMRGCTDDGLILKPSKPLMAIDAQIMQEAFGDMNGPIGQVWTTVSYVSGYTFGIILAAGLEGDYDITPTLAGFDESLAHSRVFRDNWGFMPDQLWNFSDSEPLKMKDCPLSNFCLYYVMPTFKFGTETLVLFGELEKWVPVSTNRFQNIDIGQGTLKIDLLGSPKEEVSVWIYHGEDLETVFCTMSEAGTARLVFESERVVRCLPIPT